LTSNMSFGTCSRRRLPLLRCLAKRSVTQRAHNNILPSVTHSSTKPALETQAVPQRTLPPAKMRALVALYHQADSWVTPKNLDETIDKAFVADTSHVALTLPSQEGIGWQDLVATMQDVKNSPRMAQLEADPAFRRLGTKHRAFPRREELMLEALYGVEVHDNKVLPGWEVVQEMEEGLKRNIEEDTKDQESLDFSDLLQK